MLNSYAVLLVSDTRVLEIIIFGNIKVIPFINRNWSSEVITVPFGKRWSGLFGQIFVVYKWKAVPFFKPLLSAVVCPSRLHRETDPRGLGGAASYCRS